jgi:hypothetical protein
VRQRVNATGVGRWRNYAQWLSPLTATLGSAIQSYPDATPEDGVR